MVNYMVQTIYINGIKDCFITINVTTLLKLFQLHIPQCLVPVEHAHSHPAITCCQGRNFFHCKPYNRYPARPPKQSIYLGHF